MHLPYYLRTYKFRFEFSKWIDLPSIYFYVTGTSEICSKQDERESENILRWAESFIIVYGTSRLHFEHPFVFAFSLPGSGISICIKV